jgi:peroxiredoxin/mono/diheme cytochrome c family protein
MPRYASVLIAVAILVPCAKAENNAALGRKVDNFKLQEYRGAEHALQDLAGGRATVIAFLGTECPLAKLYGPRLAELAEKYASQGVAFVGIDANRQDSLSEMAAYARTAGIKFPLLKDTGNVVADAIGAARTPEVFVLDRDHVVRYSGRIDDRYGIGYIRDKVAHDYLATVLDELLAGNPVATAHVDAVGCLIGRTHEPKAGSDVTYSKQVARIMQEHCVSCHRPGEIAPFALTDYSEVAGWADTIAEVVRERRMPPWHADPKFGHFRNDISLSDAEKDTIFKWVAAGAPEGNPADLPAPREFAQGWTLPRDPDLVLDVQAKPYVVPADGVVEYQMFVLDPGFTEDKWVKASQIIPGCAPVVHHVLCFIQPPGRERGSFDENGLGFLAAYVPGYRVAPFPDGMAKHVPAGSKLIFQMHYTPVGKEQADLSKIGFIFAKPEELTHMVQTVSTGNRGINIPPHAEDYKREATMTPYKHDLTILSYAPHMHVRGKAFSYEAIYPDGKTETLLDVPHFDFNWQTSYELAEAKTLPPGARVHCVAHWDNSENNLANPDPSKTVNWGDQTWDEMMIGFFDVAVPLDREKLLADGTIPRLEPAATVEDRAKELVSQLDGNGDGKLTKDEVPERFALMFGMLDGNKDGFVDADEALVFIKAAGGARGAFGGGRRNIRERQLQPGGGVRERPAAQAETPSAP